MIYGLFSDVFLAVVGALGMTIVAAIMIWSFRSLDKDTPK